MTDRIDEIYLVKAADSLAGARSEYANGRYDNCVNRAYFACFQAAVAALLREGIGAPGQAKQWGHDYVQAQFIGQLINRRKRYSSAMRETMIQGLRLRKTADYESERVSAIQASRCLARSRELVEAVIAKGTSKP
jgi:uncharacterized protein (UPF0332 family)